MEILIAEIRSEPMNGTVLPVKFQIPNPHGQVKDGLFLAWLFQTSHPSSEQNGALHIPTL